MKGSAIKQYPPHQLFHRKSLSSLFFKSLQRKKKEVQLISFNSQIIMTNSSFEINLINRQKISHSFNIQQKGALISSSHSKDVDSKDEFSLFVNPKTSQRQRTKFKQNKQFNCSMIKNKTELFTKKQSNRYSFSKENQLKLPQNIFSKIKNCSSIFRKTKHQQNNIRQKQKTVQRVQPWVISRDTMNETLHIKTQSSATQMQLRKPRKLKKFSQKFV